MNPNVNCPVGTPSTLMETKQHKPSTARALYHNGSVASPASALTVMTETDTTTPQYDSEDVGSSNGYEDTSDSELTSYTDSDEDYSCSESESTTDESDEEELKNERKFIVFESMLDQLFLSIAKLVALYVRLKSLTLVAWYQSKQLVVTTIPFTGGHNHS